MTTTETRRWPGYGAVWRWHFYAGLFCIPFVLWLASTGSIYLFREEIEHFIDRPYAHVAATGAAKPAADQVAAAVAAVPGSVLHTYIVPRTQQEAVQILVGVGAHQTRVYVNPNSLAVLKTEDEEGRLMQILFRLHGELMAGARGSYLVELAASWTIVMILSGLFLWWPRSQGLAGVLYPRLGSGGRRFWRDIHAVTGLWVSIFALFLLISGLPWAKSWGTYLRGIRAVVERTVGPQDWSGGAEADASARKAEDSDIRAVIDVHAEHTGHTPAQHAAMAYGPIDRIIEAARPVQLAPPVLITPPRSTDGRWGARSDAANRPLRTDLVIDGGTGAIVSRKDFAQRALADRLVGYGVAAHEGRLFGIANQMIGLFTALGLITVAISSVVLWWRRKPSDVLGAPPVVGRYPVAAGFVSLMVVLGALLPLLGASMIFVLIAEAVILRRLPKARSWLGLTTPAAPSKSA